MPNRSPNNLEKLRLKRSNSKVDGTPMTKTSARLKRLKTNASLGGSSGSKGKKSTPRKSIGKNTPTSGRSRKSSSGKRPREYLFSDEFLISRVSSISFLDFNVFHLSKRLWCLFKIFFQNSKWKELTKEIKGFLEYGPSSQERRWAKSCLTALGITEKTFANYESRHAPWKNFEFLDVPEEDIQKGIHFHFVC